VVQTWIWFAVSIAYVTLAIPEWYFASRIETINLSRPLEREPVFTDSIEKVLKLRNDAVQRFTEQQKRFDDGLINRSQLEASGMIAMGLIDSAEKLLLNNAFASIEKVAQKFDKAANANRVILRLAAASFFIAAVISVLQGLGRI
jgi:hypothetical protein